MESSTALKNTFIDAHRSLISLAIQSAGVSIQVGDTVVGELGGSSVYDYPGPYFSTLNNNSSPLQLCHSLDSQGLTRIKLIIDPFAYLAPGVERLKLTVSRLDGILLQRETTPRFIDAIKKLNRVFLPVEPLGRLDAPHKTGYCWFASDMHRKGIAVYYSPRHVSGNAWEMLDKVIDTVVAKPSHFSWITRLKLQRARLASVAVQSVGEQCELKIYWRMSTVHSLLEQPHPSFSDPVLIQSLAYLYPDEGIAEDGLLYSKSITLPSGKVSGIKVDLCGHCLHYDQTEWLLRLRKLPTDVLSKSNKSFFNDLDKFWQSGLEIAFASLGMDSYGNNRCNLYWKIR